MYYQHYEFLLIKLNKAYINLLKKIKKKYYYYILLIWYIVPYMELQCPSINEGPLKNYYN